MIFVFQGLKSEGLYRISGFSDSVEEVKTGFDKGLYHSHKNNISKPELLIGFFSKISSMAEGFQELQTASNVKMLEFSDWLGGKITV